MESCEGTCQIETAYNVIGTKKGTKYPDEFYLVGAHLDSVNEDEEGGLAPGCDTAPGANDNTSGVAGVLELARVFSKLKTDRSIVFIAFGAEETGIYGSEQYVSQLIQKKLTGKLKAFVVMDMISYAPKRANEGVWIEASKKTPALEARGKKFVNYAATYAKLPCAIGWNPENSDHVPFLERKIPGGLLIQKMCETEGPNSYPYMHSEEDTIDLQNSAFAIKILKIAAATLAEAGITFPK